MSSYHPDLVMLVESTEVQALRQRVATLEAERERARGECMDLKGDVKALTDLKHHHEATIGEQAAELVQTRQRLTVATKIWGTMKTERDAARALCKEWEQPAALANAARTKALRAILAECELRDEQGRVWGSQDGSNLAWLGLATKTLGDVASELIEGENLAYQEELPEYLRQELVHLAACCVGWLECLERREKKGAQKE